MKLKIKRNDKCFPLIFFTQVKKRRALIIFKSLQRTRVLHYHCCSFSFSFARFADNKPFYWFNLNYHLLKHLYRQTIFEWFAFRANKSQAKNKLAR